MTVPSAPGVFDILPTDKKEPWKSSYLWEQIEMVIRKTAQDYGYQEIRTPIFERTELFKRGVGETTDVVAKEMYTFEDKGNRSLSLRPEGTAPVIRAFIEHRLDQLTSIHKIYYIAPMFRYERTQAGRYRQHHQFGAEAIGNGSPEQDVEIIDLLYTLYQRLGLNNLQLNLNSIGDPECRIAYRKALQDYLKSSFDQLSNDSKQRFDHNPLRILDSKDAGDKKILEGAPSILNFLSSEASDHFQQVQKLLGQLKIPFIINSQLVRGLDYYNKTVFEITAGELGAQNSIGGGGRYDGLMKQLGGPDLPTIGFGTGLERILHTLLKQHDELPAPPSPVLFIIPLGEKAKSVCFELLHTLRQQGISSYMDFSKRKLGKVMQQASEMNAQYVAVIGDNEIERQEVELKNMQNGETLKVAISQLVHILQIEIRTPAFLNMWQQLSEPFATEESEFFMKKLKDSISQTQTALGDLKSAAETIQNLMN